jgi:hypothetical protein
MVICKRQSAQVVGGLRRLAASGEEGSRVGLQELDPVPDVTRMPEVTVKAELRTQERGAEFCDQLFASVIPRAKAVL